MRSLFLFLFLLVWSLGDSFAQDERFFKKYFLDKFREQEKKGTNTKALPTFLSYSPFYRVDLDRDGKPEGLGVENRDGQTLVNIYSLGEDNPFATFQFEGFAGGAYLYKMRLKDLGRNRMVLMLYFYEGSLKVKRYQSYARAYWLSWKKGSLDNMEFTEGPRYWVEELGVEEQLRKRVYDIDILDLNNDGLKEIMISMGHISRVWFLNENEKWREI